MGFLYFFFFGNVIFGRFVLDCKMGFCYVVGCGFLLIFLIGMILFYFCCIWVKGRERDPNGILLKCDKCFLL